MGFLTHRHIQNFSDAATLEHHWGYADRAVPCKNDAGSCEYLDVVYHSHDLGIMYAGIFWATIGVLLLIWAIIRRVRHPDDLSDMMTTNLLEKQSLPSGGSVQRLLDSIRACARRFLLPDCLRPVFGHVTRIQVLVLAVLVAYLTVWTFVGIVYKQWITPVKNSSLHNTRTSLGPLADRVGILAYALMPLTVMLSSRESLLSLITGIPYQSFNFLHRWLGYVIFAQSVLHTVGWTVIEARLYQPQPTVGREWIKQKYMVWGVVAQILITFLFVASLKPIIKLTGYEVFRKAHYVIAILFIGACWGHWSKLSCFMTASLTLWFTDRAIRLARTALLHYNYLPDGSIGFRSTTAKLTRYPDPVNGDVIRLDFEHDHDPWTIGQHFYLCFPELSIWQSHPFTPMSLPQAGGGRQKHTYIIRARRGETCKLADLAAFKTGANDISNIPQSQSSATRASTSHSDDVPTTTILLTGPYGTSLIPHLTDVSNVICIAGGTGITYILPILTHLHLHPQTHRPRQTALLWCIRTATSTAWIAPELANLPPTVTVQIFVTRVQSHVETTSKQPSVIVNPYRPDLRSHVARLVNGGGGGGGDGDGGTSTVFASGPAGMLAEVRGVVAGLNRPCGRGGEVKFIADERGEW